MLRNAGKTAALSKDDGSPTKAGLFWEHLTGQPLPASGFMNQTAFRETNIEYIRMPDGKKRMVRHLDPATGEWGFSALGLLF